MGIFKKRTPKISVEDQIKGKIREIKNRKIQINNLISRLEYKKQQALAKLDQDRSDISKRNVARILLDLVNEQKTYKRIVSALETYVYKFEKVLRRKELNFSFEEGSKFIDDLKSFLDKFDVTFEDGNWNEFLNEVEEDLEPQIVDSDSKDEVRRLMEDKLKTPSSVESNNETNVKLENEEAIIDDIVKALEDKK